MSWKVESIYGHDRGLFLTKILNIKLIQLCNTIIV